VEQKNYKNFVTNCIFTWTVETRISELAVLADFREFFYFTNWYAYGIFEVTDRGVNNMQDYDLSPRQEQFVKRISERIVNLSVFSIGIIFLLIGVFCSANSTFKTVCYGVGCSLIASSIVAYLTSLYVFKRQKEKVITEVWGLNSVFKTRGEMNIPCDASVSRMQKQLDMIGFGFRSFRDAKGGEIEEKVEHGLKIRIITIHPDSIFLKQRELDEQEIPGQIRKTILQLSEWIAKLQKIAPNSDNIQIKYYDSLPLDFLFRTDDRLYAGPYLYGRQSQQTISFEFMTNSKGFEYYMTYFEYLWSDSKDSVPKKKFCI